MPDDSHGTNLMRRSADYAQREVCPARIELHGPIVLRSALNYHSWVRHSTKSG
jgi:hypothetical protein